MAGHAQPGSTGRRGRALHGPLRNRTTVHTEPGGHLLRSPPAPVRRSAAGTVVRRQPVPGPPFPGQRVADDAARAPEHPERSGVGRFSGASATAGKSPGSDETLRGACRGWRPVLRARLVRTGAPSVRAAIRRPSGGRPSRHLPSCPIRQRRGATSHRWRTT